MASITAFKIDLEHSSQGPTPCRLSDTPGQVPTIIGITRQPSNGVEGYLKTVIHGQEDAGGRWSGPKTLIVSHFRFQSSPGGPSFRKAAIDLVPADTLAVSVSRVTPKGEITLYPDDQGNKGCFHGFDLSNPHYMETPNSAAWTKIANSAQKSGFPSELTVVTLLGRQGDQPFVLSWRSL